MNVPASDAYRVACSISKFWTRLCVARDMINDALDELPKAVNKEQDKRIEDIRDKLSSEIGLIFDLSKREAHRICNPPETTPEPPEEEVWVTQDLVPDRPNFDQWRWVGQNGKDDSHGWHHSTNSPYFMHGYIDPANGQRFEVRCRRKDLPVRCRRKDLPTPTPPETNLDPRSPESTPAEDQTNLQLAGSHGDYSLPVMDIDVQIFPPDPVFIQVDNPGIPNMLSAMLKDAYHKPIPNETRITNRVLPVGGIGGV